MSHDNDRTAPEGVLIVTGTSTGVGKTVVTAAVAALARRRGSRVAVVKPAQTGVGPGEPGDLDEVARLADVRDTHELVRYAAPLAPEAAARLADADGLGLRDCVKSIESLQGDHDLVVVEGAGGLLVRFAQDGWTMADLAVALQVPLLLVVAPDLGTLNHTALTLEAIQRRGLTLAGVVIGAWPALPDLACRSNVADLEAIAGQRLSGAIPAGVGASDHAAFLQTALTGLGPELGGRFDAAEFRQQHALSKGMR